MGEEEKRGTRVGSRRGKRIWNMEPKVCVAEMAGLYRKEKLGEGK